MDRGDDAPTHLPDDYGVVALSIIRELAFSIVKVQAEVPKAVLFSINKWYPSRLTRTEATCTTC